MFHWDRELGRGFGVHIEQDLDLKCETTDQTASPTDYGTCHGSRRLHAGRYHSCSTARPACRGSDGASSRPLDSSYTSLLHKCDIQLTIKPRELFGRGIASATIQPAHRALTCAEIRFSTWGITPEYLVALQLHHTRIPCCSPTSSPLQHFSTSPQLWSMKCLAPLGLIKCSLVRWLVQYIRT